MYMYMYMYMFMYMSVCMYVMATRSSKIRTLHRALPATFFAVMVKSSWMALSALRWVAGARASQSRAPEIVPVSGSTVRPGGKAGKAPKLMRQPSQLVPDSSVHLFGVTASPLGT